MFSLPIGIADSSSSKRVIRAKPVKAFLASSGDICPDKAAEQQFSAHWYTGPRRPVGHFRKNTIASATLSTSSKGCPCPRVIRTGEKKCKRSIISSRSIALRSNIIKLTASHLVPNKIAVSQKIFGLAEPRRNGSNRRRDLDGFAVVSR